MSRRAFDTHDHHRCIADLIARAEAHCAEAGLHLTPVRHRVLELLATEHRAMGAYDLLDHLRAEGLGSQPPVIYRALDFLVTHGFAHKIERLNAFVACAHADADHSPAFLVCRDCDAVAEIRAQDAPRLMRDAAAESGFAVDQVVIETMGTCPSCQAADDVS